MKSIHYLLILCLFVHSVCKAQQSKKSKYFSVNQIGIASGSDDGLQLQTINGLSFKHFSAGLGVGLDYYGERTMPLFIDIRKNIFTKKQTPFVYADVGTNLPWVRESTNNDWVKSDYSQGLYFDIGLGYKIPINKKFAATMSFGYTVKRFGETRRYQFDFGPNDPNYSENYDYTLRRLSLKAGLSF